jgi:hypothetical protein
MGEATTFDGSFWDVSSSMTAGGNSRLSDLLNKTFDSGFIPKVPEPGHDDSYVSPDKETKKEVTLSDPELGQKIRDHVANLLKELSKVDDSNDARENLIYDLQSLATYRAGWDGEDAESIAQVSIDSAVEFVHGFTGEITFDAYPDPDGTAGISAELEDDRILLSFKKDKTIAYFIKRGPKVNRGYGEDRQTIYKILDTLL